MSLTAWAPALAQSTLSSFGAWVFLSIKWAERPIPHRDSLKERLEEVPAGGEGYWFCLWSGSGHTGSRGTAGGHGAVPGWGSLKRTGAASPALRDGTDLLDFFDVTVFALGVTAGWTGCAHCP